MGLDITAYRQIKPAPDAEIDRDGYIVDYENFMRVYVNPDYPERATDLVDRGTYTHGTDSVGFRAGSYSGYNVWREELARLAGYPPTPYTHYSTTQMRHDAGAWAATEGPFWELINFSDCEGAIGPAASAKLARDFAEWDDRAKAKDGPESIFYSRYTLWRAAFEMAADSGMVDFH